MRLLLLFAATMVVMTSCQKNDQVKPVCNQPFCNYTTIIVNLEHHGKAITNGSVYLKKDTQEMPDKYDVSAKVEWDGTKSVARFPQMKPGNYYIYGTGYDGDINEVVSGGKPVSISWGYQFLDYRTTLAVTESSHGTGGPAN